jgi:hypothetical protein
VLGNFERTLRHIIDFEAEVAILAEVPQDPRVVMIPYRHWQFANVRFAPTTDSCTAASPFHHLVGAKVGAEQFGRLQIRILSHVRQAIGGVGTF